jgi:hypothetical protein
MGKLAPYIATSVGVLLGFIWNWTMGSAIIWRRRQVPSQAGYAAEHEADTS